LPVLLASRMLAPMSDDPITRLNVALEGRYRIERELGVGGMAGVCLAERRVVPNPGDCRE
jgi:hypothetical protein